jgi:hypothetical protein
METCSQSFTYKSPETFLNALGLNMDIDVLKVRAPLLADGLRLHRVFSNFTERYINWAFEDEAALAACDECTTYWNSLQNGRLIGDFNGRNRSSYGDAYTYA